LVWQQQKRKNMSDIIAPVFFIPSFFGDIRIEPDGKKACILIMEQLSPAERKALDALMPIAFKKGWLAKGVGITTWSSSDKYPNVRFTAPMAKVASVIAKAIKPGREIVSAIQFSNGKMQEITEAEYDDATPLPVKGEPYRAPGALEPIKPVAAAAVAKPALGCPAPDFEKADIRATRVLRTFLNEEQREDWDKYNRFITIGAVTGHRYMVTSRYATDSLADYQRSLYDLDDDKPYCVHDNAVPPAEEVLALHLLVQLPGHENYLRHLGD
jgi:hypothetical protein